MKNLNNNRKGSQVGKPFVSPTVWGIMKKVLFVLLLINVSALAQNENQRVVFGGGVQSNCSANWHGSTYSPYLAITKKYSSLQLGPVIQKRNSALCGVKAEFITTISSRLLGDSLVSYNYSDKDVVEINFFCYAQYINNAKLSYAAARIEEKTHRDGTVNWNQVNVSTAETGVGFEIQVNISNNVSWRSRIGGTVYYHTKYVSGMYHEKVAPVLNIGTGIHINIL